jgi:hypothetical protein
MKNTLKIIIFFVVALVFLAMLALTILEKNAPAGEPKNNIQQPQPRASSPSEISPTPDQTSIAIDDSLKNRPLLGKQTDNSDILSRYGKYAFESFQKNPDLIEKIRAVDNNFDPSQMETSFPSHTYLLDNGKEYLVIGGCTPHDCAGSEKIILYSEKSNLLFEAMENSSQTQLQIIGSPTEKEQDLITYYYFHN